MDYYIVQKEEMEIDTGMVKRLGIFLFINLLIHHKVRKECS